MKGRRHQQKWILAVAAIVLAGCRFNRLFIAPLHGGVYARSGQEYIATELHDTTARLTE